MGLFKKKSASEHDAPRKGMLMVGKIKLADSLEEEEVVVQNVVTGKKKNGSVFRRYKLPTFRVLVEDNDEESVVKEIDLYEPPKFHLADKIKAAPAKEPRIEPTGSDQTFDIRDDETVSRFDDTASQFGDTASKFDDTASKFEGQHNDFSQFVFDETFNKLETVVVGKSDPGASDAAENAKNVSKILAAAGNLHKAFMDENAGDTRNLPVPAQKKLFRSAQKPKTVKPNVPPPRSDSKLYRAFIDSRNHDVSMDSSHENPFRTFGARLTADPKALFPPSSESSTKNHSSEEQRDRFLSKASHSLVHSKKSPKKSTSRPSAMETSPFKTSSHNEQSRDQFQSLASRSFVHSQKSTGRPSAMEKSLLDDEQSHDQFQFQSLTSQSFVQSQKSTGRPSATGTSPKKTFRDDEQSRDQFQSLTSRSFVHSQKSTARPSPMETSPKKTFRDDEQSRDQFQTLASRSFAHSQKSTGRPPKTITTSDQSFASNASLANATITSLDEFPEDHPFFDNNGVSMNDDPFGETMCWATDMDPFGHAQDHDNKSIFNNSDTGSLIDSIKQSMSRAARADPDENSYKPDPSPRGVQLSRSDSRVSYWEKGAVAYTGVAGLPPPPPPPPPPQLPKAAPQSSSPESSSSSQSSSPESSPEQSPREVRSDTQISYWEKGSVAYSAGPQKIPPTGVPKNAILASMLFRQTYPGKAPSKSPATKKNVDHEDEQLPADMPPSILTDESDSTVSSVTEEASSFYQKNFESGWKYQAQNVLNNYHKARKPRSRVDPSTYSAEPYHLERVEEEYTNMFSA